MTCIALLKCSMLRRATGSKLLRAKVKCSLAVAIFCRRQYTENTNAIQERFGRARTTKRGNYAVTRDSEPPRRSDRNNQARNRSREFGGNERHSSGFGLLHNTKTRQREQRARWKTGTQGSLSLDQYAAGQLRYELRCGDTSTLNR